MTSSVEPAPGKHALRVPEGAVLVLLLAILPAFFGGGEWRAVQIATLAAVAALYLLHPPNRSPGWWLNIPFAVLALCPLLAFLPSALFKRSSWRLQVEQLLPEVPFLFVSPQPWLTLDLLPLFYGGLAFVWWLLASGWQRDAQRTFAISFSLGSAVILLAAGLSLVAGRELPFWLNEDQFGPFATRNQTAAFLAMTFMVNVALLHSAVMRRRLRGMLFWMFFAVFTLFGIFICGSRAGAILAAAGLGTYWLLCTVAARRYLLATAGVGIAVLCAGILALFPESLRLAGDRGAGTLFRDPFRHAVHADALAMTSDAPATGIGLGNIDAVFDFFRERSEHDYRTTHPESDWLWLAAECGWPAVMLAAIILAAFGWRTLPTLMRQPAPTRLAGMACLVQAVLHGFMDVPSHAPGNFFATAALVSLAWPGPRKSGPLPSCAAPLLGGGLAIAALLWIITFPSSQPRPAVTARADDDLTGLDDPSTVKAALRRTPLDWRLHEAHAHASLSTGLHDEAYRHFRIASSLEPFSVALAEHESQAWFNADPERAAVAVEETVRRSSGTLIYTRYEFYLRMSESYPSLRARLLQIAEGTPALEVIRLKYASDDFFRTWLDNLQQADALASLDDSLKKSLAEVIVARRGADGLSEFMRRHTGFSKHAHQSLARALAKEEKYEAAVRVLLEFLPPPALPKIPSESVRDLRRSAAAQPANLTSSLALVRKLLAEGESSEALAILSAWTSHPQLPGWGHYLIARLQASHDDWKRAWEHLTQYLAEAK
jgi:hypothetical protein